MIDYTAPQDSRPPSLVAQPYALVYHNGQLRLAWITTFFGGGVPFGPFLGGRGHIISDSGEWTAESREVVVLKACDFVYEWERRPTYIQLMKARARELAQAA